MLHESSILSPAEAFETRTSFALGEARAMWVVRTGQLDLFAIRERPGQEAAALRPLASLGPSEAAFALFDTDGTGVTVVARRGHDAQVTRRSFAGLHPADDRAPTLDEAALLEVWIDRLASLAADGLPPKSAVAVTPNESVTTDDDPRTLTARDAVIWVRLSSGSARVLGAPELVALPDAAAYPVSRSSWIEVQPSTVLAASSTTAVIEDRDVWAGLDAFHAHVLSRLARRIDRADDALRERLRERAGADAKAVATALEDLASPLQRSAGATEPRVGEVLDTPLMRACQTIGAALDVQIRAHPDLVRGLPVNDPVAAIAQASGVRCRRVALKDDWWKQGGEPLLVFRDSDNRPAALLPRRGRRGYVICDPDQHTATPLTAAAIAELNPFAYMFYRPFPQKPMTPGALLGFGLRGCRRELVTIAAMSIASGLLTLVLPIVTGIVFDSLIPGARHSELVAVCLLLVVTALASALFNLTRGFAVLRLQGRLAATVQAGLWDRLLGLPVPFFRQYSAGDLADRSMSITQIRAVLTASTLGAILSGVFSVFSFALLFYYSRPLAFIATALTVVAALVTLSAGAAELRLQRRIAAQAGIIAGRVLEFLTGIAKFRIAGAERRAFVLWVREFARQKRTDFDARRITTLVAVFNSVYLVVCLGVLFAANSGLAPPGAALLSTGYFLAFVAAFTQFMGAVLALSSAVVGIMNIVPLYERASPIFLTLPEVTAAQRSPGELTGEIEAHHLMFRYRPDAPLVLRDLSFHVNAGEYVAFVGPSGCGKSTLFRLLLGFETAESGTIYYDRKDLAGLDVAAIRRQIGVVLQTGALFSGSIQTNISGAAWMPVEDIWEAVRLAGLEEDVKRMPMGLYTMVTAGGGGLSGGQRQRVLIARAIVGRPRVLLFDEATSALDNRTQAIVSSSLNALKATRIVIAHRLSTILEADRIFVMDQGRIVQSGTYTELMAMPGLFRELAQRQLT